jgi:phosphoribosyl 1,2-cyclic phosphodiesterase
MDRLRFQSFGSGSSGNCYFIGNASYGILIDAGIGVRTIRKYLKNMGMDFHHIWGVFITHDHADHIRAIGSVGEKYKVPVYTTRKIHEGIDRSYCVTEKLSGSRRFIEKNESVQVGDFRISSFEVSHDSTDSVGYTVEYKEKKFTFATDLGYVSETAAEHLTAADFIVFESNYDEEMLKNGPYPIHLQNRITADTGHLSNKQCADFLEQNYHEKLKYIFLCHLSKENNQPELAYNTVKEQLERRNIIVGKDVQLIPLERMSPSKMYLLESIENK